MWNTDGGSGLGLFELATRPPHYIDTRYIERRYSSGRCPSSASEYRNAYLPHWARPHRSVARVGARRCERVQWFIVSLVLSVVLTLVANVALRVFPELGPRVARWFTAITASDEPDQSMQSSRVRVFFPWKAMIVVSIILTALLSVLRWVM